MCLGRESLDHPHLCGVAEEVFAALPWPCVVLGAEGGRTVMVNAAFEGEFGLDARHAGPRWLAEHLLPTADNDAFLFRGHARHQRRYRMTRQQIDTPQGAFQVVYLIRLPDDEPATDEPPLSERHAALRADVNLTPRESQVLDGIMRGKLNKVIASELRISPKTVELHRANLMAKLRVHNVVELARAVLDAAPAGAAVGAAAHPEASPPG